MKVNDKFPTKKEAVTAIKEFLDSKNFTYDQIQFTPKLITFNCIGKKEFNCDAVVHSLYKKKEDAFVIKKIKLNHKCPPDLKNMGSVEFIRNEIRKCGEDLRIGEMVQAMNKKNMKIGYNSVWRALHEGEDEDGAQAAFVKEFVMLNPECRALSGPDHIFVFFPVLEYARKIVEIKIVKRKESGYVLYALIYDPHDCVQTLAFMVTDERSVAASKDMFMANLGKYMDVGSAVFLCEIRDAYLFEHETFFIKVRSICREVYRKCKDRNVVIKVWNFCNSNEELREIDVLREVIDEFNSKEHVEDEDRKARQSDEKGSTEDDRNKENENAANKSRASKAKSKKKGGAAGVIKLENYQKGDRILYGLQNLSEPDLDLLYYNLSGDLMDISNAITKLISEHNAARRKKDAAFGENIRNKIERKIEEKCAVDECANDTYNVTLGKETCNVSLNDMFCTCGIFQEYACPCTHALVLIRHLGLDPYNFVSTVFLFKKEMYGEVVPVVNENLKQQNVQVLLRRGPGRPKKGNVRRYDEAVQ
ncbi:putative Zinc finger, SWIM-type, Zinc finger, PMZ-type protein [Trachipleistophora hominis]|uniref:Putative Zinc finger, SWIM-type, Zinc finger, PMZ-type protein n=1 Tax=Trachipleistophora hominis TaxID=72359 RepID=L7JVH4_TRAHO|nr:putative Zinc finger, SWIM-type, Zinc finger, PMZ-type protein [Trachipleistophora hominis]